MKKLGLLGRYGVVATAVTALALGAATSTAAAVQDPCNCGQYAWSACSYDEQGNPIQVTFECYEQRYSECLAWCEGGLAFNPDYLRDRA